MKTIGVTLLAMLVSFAAGVAARDGRWARWIGIADAQAQGPGGQQESIPGMPPGAQAYGNTWCLVFGSGNLFAVEKQVAQFYSEGAQILSFSYHDKNSTWEALACKKA